MLLVDPDGSWLSDIGPSIGERAVGGERHNWDAIFVPSVSVSVDTETLSNRCHLRNASLTPVGHTRRPGPSAVTVRGSMNTLTDKPGKGQNFKALLWILIKCGTAQTLRLIGGQSIFPNDINPWFWLQMQILFYPGWVFWKSLFDCSLEADTAQFRGWRCGVRSSPCSDKWAIVIKLGHPRSQVAGD